MGGDGASVASYAMQPLFQEGDQVEYWSETYSMYMEAVVQKINLSEGCVSSYDLDVKTKAVPNRIRYPSNQHAHSYQQVNSQNRSACDVDLTDISKEVSSHQIQSHNKSACEIDFSGAAKENIPTPAISSSAPPTYMFQVGDEVEYQSTTHKQWMPAKVLQVNSGGETYDLDVKKGAQPKRMRYPPQKSYSEAQPAPSASMDVQAAIKDARAAMLAALHSQTGPSAQPSMVPPAQAMVKSMAQPLTVPPSAQVAAMPASRGISPVSGRVGLQLPVPAVATSSSSVRTGNPQVVHIAVGSPTRKGKANYSPAHSYSAAAADLLAAHVQKPSLGLPVQSRSSSPSRAKGSTTPPHPLAAGAKHVSRRSLPGTSGAAPAWPSLLVGGRDVNQQDCLPVVVCSGHTAPSSSSTDPRQIRVRSAAASCTPSGARGILELAELQLGVEPFNPSRASVRSQLLAKLGLPSTATVKEMQGFRGGLNEGVWFVSCSTAAGMEEYVLKLVRCNRIAHNILTEAENLVRISREHPRTMCDPAVAFPFKIFSCLGVGGAKKNDLIVMRKVRGERLAEWIARKWYGKQTPQLLQTFEALGAKLAEFHAHYGNVQHGDFQPSNVFYDEERDQICFIDVGGMGVPTMETDAEHFRKSLGLLAETYGPQLAVDGCQRFDQGYQRVARIEQ